MINDIFTNDLKRLLGAVKQSKKCLRDILITNEVNVWVYVRKNHFGDNDNPDNITSPLIDYYEK